MMLGVAIWELPRKGVPVGLAIPLAHAGEDAGGGRHVQPHRKRLSSKETLHQATQHLQLSAEGQA